LPQKGGKYDQFKWEEERLERTEVNLRFFKKDWLELAEGKKNTAKHVEACAIPTKSRTETFVGYLEAMFGPGNIHRGWGPKPQVQKRRNGVKTPLELSSSVSRGGSASREEIGEDAQRRKRPRDDDNLEGRKKVKLDVDVDMTVTHVDKAGWTGALQRLIKGKTSMDEEDLKELSNVLDEVDGAKEDLKDEVLEKTRLGEVVRQLSMMKESEIPFGDAGRLGQRARMISEFWQAKYSK